MAMSGWHLGMGIHGGGQDLIFPSHENRIAQAPRAHEGHLYCRTRVRNSFVTADEHKMSKSLGSVLLVRDLLGQVFEEVIRMALLSSHYQHPLNWNARRLDAVRLVPMYVYRVLKMEMEGGEARVCNQNEGVLAAPSNDLNVPSALMRPRELADAVQSADPAAARLRAQAGLRVAAGLLEHYGSGQRVRLWPIWRRQRPIRFNLMPDGWSSRLRRGVLRVPGAILRRPINCAANSRAPASFVRDGVHRTVWRWQQKVE